MVATENFCGNFFLRVPDVIYTIDIEIDAAIRTRKVLKLEFIFRYFSIILSVDHKKTEKTENAEIMPAIT